MNINPKNLIIYRPEKQTKQQRALAMVLMVAFWGIFLYLLRPILVVLGWAVAYYIFKTTTIDMKAQEIFRMIFVVYLPLVLILSAVLWGWAAYNRLRFSGSRDKRKRPHEPINFDDVAASFHIPTEYLENIYKYRRITFHFNDDGRIHQVSCRRFNIDRPPTAAVPAPMGG